MAIVYKTLWDEVKELVLEQYKSSPNLIGLIRSVVEECVQPLEDAAFSLQGFLDVRTAEGEWLDVLGKLVNLKRNGGETDTDFRERIIAEAAIDSAGTPDNVIYNTAILSGDTRPSYMDEADATFFVYTGPKPKRVTSENIVTEAGGDTILTEVGDEPITTESVGGTAYGGADQLYARQVKKLAPAGVLGLVGAAIQFADGSLMGDAENRLMMMVADDSTVSRSMVLVDNNNTPIVTPQGVPLRAVTKGVTVPKVEVNMGGQYYDGVRVKDLPAAQNDEGFLVRDSDAGGTVKADKIDAATVDEIWDEIENENNDNG